MLTGCFEDGAHYFLHWKLQTGNSFPVGFTWSYLVQRSDPVPGARQSLLGQTSVFRFLFHSYALVFGGLRTACFFTEKKSPSSIVTIIADTF